MMRKKIVAANWKMNKDLTEALQLAEAIVQSQQANPAPALLILAPPATSLYHVGRAIHQTEGVSLAAQNCHQKASGAYTGEISAPMIQSTGAEYVILGHSERREYFAETDALILEKTKMALNNGLKVIYCCGEPLSVREQSKQESFVGKQLDESILLLTQEEMANIVIAYEPIWAIGTGLNATPEQAQKMHWFIRWKLEIKYGKQFAQSVSILYGGSVKADNAATIFSQPDVDGGLVGGASLVAADFMKIAHSF